MQLLWTSKSQVLRLEESSLYGSQADEVITFVSKILWLNCFVLILVCMRSTRAGETSLLAIGEKHYFFLFPMK